MSRTLRLCATFLALGLVVSACSKKDDDAADDTKGAQSSALAGKTVSVCSDIPYPPLEDFKDKSDDEFTGFDVDLMEYAAKKAGGSVAFKVTGFDGIIPALTAKDCDVIASAMTITDERKGQVDFSQPYYDSKQSLVVRADEKSKFATLADLANSTIGVQAETTGQAYAEENKPAGATIKALPGSSDLFNALRSRDIDAILQDAPVNVDGVKKNPEFVYQQEFDTNEQYGFAVRKGDSATLAWINDGIDASKADGTYDRLYDKWLKVG